MESASPAPQFAHAIVPNGHCKLMFNYADDFRCEYNRDRPFDTLRRPSLVGQMDRHAVVQALGRIGVIGVEFRAAGARALFGGPLHEIEGRLVFCDEALSPQRFSELDERLQYATGDRERIVLIEGVLLQWLAEAPVDSVMERAQLLLATGEWRVDAVAAALGFSRRTLERRFQDYAGMAPKRVASIARLQRALREYRLRPEQGWAQVALSAGYYDQAHLLKDFRRLAGAPPADFLRKASAISAAFAGGPAAGPA